MITEIGVTAGEIWNALEVSDELSVEALRHSLQRDSEVVLMAVGWLCREGYCTLAMKKEGIVVSLRQQSVTQN